MVFAYLGILFGLFLLQLTEALAQVKSIPIKKEYKTFNTDKAPIIDGILDEEIWTKAAIAGDFIQSSPKPNKPGSNSTEIKLLYDNEAIYIAARMHENKSDSINNFLTQRDDFGNADWFIVVFNTYRDGINGEGFGITPAGVQIDIKYSSDGESSAWDAVWESATNIDDKGWTAELRIPYSALRFPEKDQQLWGINFGRETRRKRERAWWNFIDPTFDGFLTQTGLVSGIENIKPPLRLAFFPYASAYVENNAASGGHQSYSFNGGMDVKYGLSDAFTLDMTLIPDFGQTRFDNKVLNLSQFEVQFNENRQFFTEGLELFNKAGIFYSRRIGGLPVNYYAVDENLGDEEEIHKNPVQSQLINATKISGRNKNGLGIGVFNAIENESHAELRNTSNQEIRKVQTNPLTNYNVLVFDQVLRSNSFVTLTNTNVTRDGHSRDANVSKLDFQLANKQNKYAFSGAAALSNIFNSNQTISGNYYQVGFGKISGNFTFSIEQEQISDKYNPRDLGFLNITNIQRSSLYADYSVYEPFSIFNFARHSFEMVYERLYQPDKFVNLGFSYFTIYNTKQFHAFSFSAAIEPIETNDYFEARTYTQYYKFPINYSYGGFISSDYSRPFAIDIRVNRRVFNEPGRSNFYYEIAPRFRPNDRLFFVIGYNKDKRLNENGFVRNQNDSIILGRRRVDVHESYINGTYTFNNKMALNLALRHYWSSAKYNLFRRINPANGELLQSDYIGFDENNTPLHDISFNAFNIDLTYKWRFAPGSEISLVWKNVILEEGTALDISYYKDLESILKAPQINNFSIKILYYINYQDLKRKTN